MVKEEPESTFERKVHLKEDYTDLFLDDIPDNVATGVKSGDKKPCWSILVVDDEEDVYIVTEMALSGFEYAGREMQPECSFN